MIQAASILLLHLMTYSVNDSDGHMIEQDPSFIRKFE